IISARAVGASAGGRPWWRGASAPSLSTARGRHARSGAPPGRLLTSPPADVGVRPSGGYLPSETQTSLIQYQLMNSLTGPSFMFCTRLLTGHRLPVEAIGNSGSRRHVI